jgi:hypothetical protein
MYKMASINYVIDIMVIILTSSRPKSNICLHYVQCTHTNLSSSDAIQGDSVPGARVGVHRAFVDVTDLEHLFM